MQKNENLAEESKKPLQLTIQVLEDRNSLPLSFDDIELSTCSSCSCSDEYGACSCSSCCQKNLSHHADNLYLSAWCVTYPVNNSINLFY